MLVTWPCAATKAHKSLHAYKTFNKPGYAVEIIDLEPERYMSKPARAISDTPKNHANGNIFRGRYSITVICILLPFPHLILF